VTVEIEPDAVHGAAGTLRGSVGPLDGLASSCYSMADFAQPDMLNGLAAFKVTWSTALEILADDVEYVADRADARAPTGPIPAPASDVRDTATRRGARTSQPGTARRTT